MHKSIAVIAAVVAVLLGQPAVASASPSSPSFTKIVEPTRTHVSQAPASLPGNGIYYHGGPLMLTAKHVYVIWYGFFDRPAGAIISSFLRNLGGSPYFGIERSYYDGNGARVDAAVTLAGAITDNYSRGTRLRDRDVVELVSDAITSGALAADPAGVYYVLTAYDVDETSGFGTKYCAWHGYVKPLGIKIAFVGNPGRFMFDCAAQMISPNGEPPADAMVSLMAHELDEAATNPDTRTGWYLPTDAGPDENADMCAWTFGKLHKAANGSYYNVTLGSREFLIQRNWVNDKGGYCALAVRP